MPKITQPSRLNPAYLAARHGGMFFCFVALGLACGLAIRALFEPSRYHSEVDIAVSIIPAESAARFDWDARQRQWRGVLSDPRERNLLGANLRSVVKLAAVPDPVYEPASLSEELARFVPSRIYSAALYPARFAARLGPVISVTRRDLAANLDFQSLASIVSDLDPPKDVENWDFSAFQSDVSTATRNIASHMITRPGPEDRFFRIFYRLFELQYPHRAARSPEEAWRAAVDELADRLERETSFAGGGGFGPRARRELAREIAAIPALAANGLYRAVAWFGGESAPAETNTWADRWSDDVRIELTHSSPVTGSLAVGVRMALFPLAVPRDTALTRLPPLMVATLLGYLSARESAASVVRPPVSVVPDPAPPPLPEPEPEQPESGEETETPAPALIPQPGQNHEIAVPEEEVAAYRSKVRALEDALRQARLARDNAARRLEAARSGEKRLAMEAIAARARVDRLRERYDEVLAAPVQEPEETIPLETAKLLLARDEVLERLAALLEYCTEEHPFVRQARRELAAIEALLAKQGPIVSAPRLDEARATRIDNLRLELETASATTDGLDERRRRQAAEIEAALAAVASAERNLASLETDLGRLKDSAPTPRRIAVAAVPAAPRRSAPPPVAPPPPPAPAAPARVDYPPELSLAQIPSGIPLIKYPPSWETPLRGLALGIIVGLFWILARELLTFKFSNVREARRLVAYPLLAALPAYDAKTFRTAAKGAKGELTGSRPGRLLFTPSPVEFSEPQPAGRRGKLMPVRRRPRVLVWIIAVLALAGGIGLHFAAASGFARPSVAFHGEMLPPPAAAYHLLESVEEDGAWGNLP